MRRKSLVTLLSLAAFGLSATPALAASRTVNHSYNSSYSLRGWSSGKPDLQVHFGDAGGSKITSVQLTYPSGASWVRNMIRRDVTVSSRVAKYIVKGRSLEVYFKVPQSSVRVTAKPGSAKLNAKLASGHGSVTLTAAEESPVTTATNGQVNDELSPVYKAIMGTQITADGALNSAISGLGTSCPTLTPAVAAGTHGKADVVEATDAELLAYDEYLTTGLPTILGDYNGLDSGLNWLGYNINVPLSSVTGLANGASTKLGITSANFCSELSALPSDTSQELDNLESSLKSNTQVLLQGMVTDLTEINGDFLSIEAGLPAGSSGTTLAEEIETELGTFNSTAALNSNATALLTAEGQTGLTAAQESSIAATLNGLM